METSKSFLTPYQRGFYCGDQSIAYPIKDETIPGNIFLPLFGCFLPLSVVIFEFLKVQALRSSRCSCHNIPYKPLLAGLAIAVIFGLVFIVDIVMKNSVGELRPNFLAVCRPNWSEINCTYSNGNLQYISPIPCNATDNYDLQKARTSFPSGHASLSAFSVTVIIIYLNEICPTTSTCVSCARLIMQSLLVMLAFFMGLSRIWDHMHHWWDVAIGFLLGMVLGYLAKKQVLDVFFSNENVYNVKENGIVLPSDSETNKRTRNYIVDNANGPLLSANGEESNTTKV